MSVAIDTEFTNRLEVAGLSNGAFRLHFCALLYSDRFDHNPLSQPVVAYLRRAHGIRKAAVLELVEAGLWTPTDSGYLLGRQHVPAREVRARIPDVVRDVVYERDEHRCLICGTTHRLTLDHIVPFSMGGEDTIDNLRTLCGSCNSRRGAGRYTDEELRDGR